MRFCLYLITILTYNTDKGLLQALIASNNEIVTGNIKYMCAFFRAKDYSIDDVSMPEILTFCSCSVIHRNWALTARQCYVQMDWYVSAITTAFTNKLPEKLHKIERIQSNTELSLVRVTPAFDVTPVQFSRKAITATITCKILGFSTPNSKPVDGNDNTIYKVWHMEGDVLQANVQALNYDECRTRFNNYLSEYKTIISSSTLCINHIGYEYLEPCAFDRGAPIICNDKLQGVLIYERPLPAGVPIHLPVGCYGNIDTSFSIYAESITEFYAQWIDFTAK